MPRAPPVAATAATASHLSRCEVGTCAVPIDQRALVPGDSDLVPGLFPLPTCANRSTFPGACAPQETQDVSISSLTPVATGTTVVFDSNPAIRFQRAVDAQLAVADLERSVRRLARQLTPVLPAQSCPARRSVRSAWWLSA